MFNIAVTLWIGETFMALCGILIFTCMLMTLLMARQVNRYSRRSSASMSVTIPGLRP